MTFNGCCNRNPSILHLYAPPFYDKISKIIQFVFSFTVIYNRVPKCGSSAIQVELELELVIEIAEEDRGRGRARDRGKDRVRVRELEVPVPLSSR